MLTCFFFFSSRRRHTRWPRDWSSDVCSSDLERLDAERDRAAAPRRRRLGPQHHHRRPRLGAPCARGFWHLTPPVPTLIMYQQPVPRSEERRVGKECRCGGWRYHKEKEREDKC